MPRPSLRIYTCRHEQLGRQVTRSLPKNVTYGLTPPTAASYQISALKPIPQAAEVQVLQRWWDAYPTVKSSPPGISAEELATLLQDPTRSDYAVIDVRRNDHGVRYTYLRFFFRLPAAAPRGGDRDVQAGERNSAFDGKLR